MYMFGILKLQIALMRCRRRLLLREPGKEITDTWAYYMRGLLNRSKAIASEPEFAALGALGYSESIAAAADYANANPTSDELLPDSDPRKLRAEAANTSNRTCFCSCLLLSAITLRTTARMWTDGKSSYLMFENGKHHTLALRLPRADTAVLAGSLMRKMCFDCIPPVTEGVIKIRILDTDFDLPVSLHNRNGELEILIDGNAAGVRVHSNGVAQDMDAEPQRVASDARPAGERFAAAWLSAKPYSE